MSKIARRERDSQPTRGDRAWAWAGALLAAGVSVAVNVAHALPVSRGFAAFAAVLPLLVLISAEQMARRLLGRMTWPVLLTSGLCAYSLSFWHAVLLLRSWGEPLVLQITGAVAVDVLAVGSVVALYMAGRASGPDVREAPDAAASDAPPEPDVRPDAATPDGAPAVRPYASTLPLVAPPASVRPARPAPVRTGEVDGRAVASVRTLDGPVNGRTGPVPIRATRTDVRTPDAAGVWARWEADGRPADWHALGAALGIGAEAARKRAGRRPRPDASPDASPDAGDDRTDT